MVKVDHRRLNVPEYNLCGAERDINVDSINQSILGLTPFSYNFRELSNDTKYIAVWSITFIAFF